MGRGRKARQAYFSAMRPRRGRWAEDGGGGGEEGSCSSDSDCPPSDPTCSEYGFCQCECYQPGDEECWGMGEEVCGGGSGTSGEGGDSGGSGGWGGSEETSGGGSCGGVEVEIHKAEVVEELQRVEEVLVEVE